MKKIYIVLLFVVVNICVNCKNSTGQDKIRLMLAEKYFSELKEILDIDNGNLWGINLYGPIMFVDPETREVIANKQTKDSSFTKKGNVYYGVLPKEINIANTARDYKDELWTFVKWNNNLLSEKERNILLIHECWHRIQSQIGLPPCFSNNYHLDELEGAILFKIELMALLQAIQKEETDDIIKDVRNALIVRQKRQMLFPDNNENIYECHEGLAEYTALKLYYNNKPEKDIVIRITDKLESNLNKEGYSNYFAYLTGPAYGMLLDKLSSCWTKDILNGKSIIDVVSGFVEDLDNLDMDDEIERIIDYYNIKDFINQEKIVLNNLKEEERKIKEEFLESDLLIIQNNNISFTYDPNEKIIEIDSLGFIYKTMRLSGDFGIIDAHNGVMITYNWGNFIIPYKEKECEIELKDGYQIFEFDKHKYMIRKIE